MDIKLLLRRKLKGLFMRFALHKAVRPFEGFLLNLVYMSQMSAWRSQNSGGKFNDFYKSEFDTNMRQKVFQVLLDSENLNDPVDYLEFGVASGRSFKWWVAQNQNPESRFSGFDTFTGLPENWDVFKAGDMTMEGKFPEVNDPRAKFYKGLFQETLPDFLDNYDFRHRKVIHLDADLYSSTLYVMTMLARYIKPGDIMIFDEFAVPTHEFKAFSDFCRAYYFKFELVYAGNNYLQSAFKVISTTPDIEL
ncbi:MAG: class I SAM-dependent methyltransferase [Candidatus Kapabacteria bacterium]|nr:class I SAM-dependent methyltransferase [Ignavibacteriota bacterium]MCW5886280.1 class I SAM-dependent methyltransferase [Candidatus Kapabacteria bacterium]